MKFMIEPDFVYFSFLRRFHMEIFFKICVPLFHIRILHSNESWNCYHTEDFSSTNYLYSPSKNVAVCGTMGYMVNLLGLTSSWTRNSQEEWLFRWELPANGRGIHPRNGILPEPESLNILNLIQASFLCEI
jgi:hypothetical protein